MPQSTNKKDVIPLATIRIENDYKGPHVYIDGEYIPGVIGFSVTNETEDQTIIHLDLSSDDLTFEGDLCDPDDFNY